MTTTLSDSLGVEDQEIEATTGCCDNCPRGDCPRDSCPRDFCPRRLLSKETIVQGRLLSKKDFCQRRHLSKETIVQGDNSPRRLLSKETIVQVLMRMHTLYTG